MMKSALVLLALLGAVSATAAEAPAAPTLSIGDPAPRLAVQHWLKGEPVSAFRKGQLYVVDFWATWCVPCIESMPHLSELAKKYAGRVTFVGVSVRDPSRSKEPVTMDKVRKFVEKQGARMSYTVAMDDPAAQPVYTTWMGAAGMRSIPTIFIVDGGGRIAWIGNPNVTDIDQPLSQLLDGSFDRAAARGALDRMLEEQRGYAQAMAVMGPVIEAMGKEDYPAALAHTDRLIAEDPQNESRVFLMRFLALLKVDETRAFAYALARSADPAILKRMEVADTAEYLAQLAAQVVRMKDLSQTACLFVTDTLTRRMAAGHELGAEQYAALAEAHFRLGEVPEAIEMQGRAVALAEKRGEQWLIDQTRQALQTYKAGKSG